MKPARLLTTFALILVLAAAGAGGVYLWFLNVVAAPGPLQAPVTMIIAPGTGVAAIGRQLAAAGVVEKPWLPALAARRSGQDRTLKPGEYRFDPGISVTAILDKLARHDVVARFVTIPEGLVTADILSILDAAEGLTGAVASQIAQGDLLPEGVLRAVPEPVGLVHGVDVEGEAVEDILNDVGADGDVGGCGFDKFFGHGVPFCTRWENASRNSRRRRSCG